LYISSLIIVSVSLFQFPSVSDREGQGDERVEVGHLVAVA
jgi:hypothetical protein